MFSVKALEQKLPRIQGCLRLPLFIICSVESPRDKLCSFLSGISYTRLKEASLVWFGAQLQSSGHSAQGLLRSYVLSSSNVTVKEKTASSSSSSSSSSLTILPIFL